MPTVYITAPPDAADSLAETLVDKRLAACVNRLSTTSTYRWDGEIHHDDEAVLLAKTTDDAYDDLVDCVKREHPYDVPCIERFDEADVLESFAEWRAESVE
ncbi:putative divalent cation tolerance protein [Natrialba magadii ATCC 43099]|uniref:CutA1 divalent ion tolerance protein n=1 Tax=Natrialba magadii (strain ATCC 43099 / DSM 3394 / CCM 3739 / CIP 104546 / IAM 13178 / JCM 8861 / NBRC 102185 / NCIMB 2190 / MS3) TaxID=547559 RepID=D3STX0_NATMM|nr:divalent-cation tolerance protein CutA [Natrialba magadii]ADD07059.1 putative divalent cation tolerance protein [Natrialba magadii ATCC 43099]ELY28798.1 CutA1 divalent ion tolerance protein [Natrialba magadii ATCC 43099]